MEIKNNYSIERYLDNFRVKPPKSGDGLNKNLIKVLGEK